MISYKIDDHEFIKGAKEYQYIFTYTCNSCSKKARVITYFCKKCNLDQYFCSSCHKHYIKWYNAKSYNYESTNCNERILKSILR